MLAEGGRVKLAIFSLLDIIGCGIAIMMFGFTPYGIGACIIVIVGCAIGSSLLSM